jgi:hypothetical protein
MYSAETNMPSASIPKLNGGRLVADQILYHRPKMDAFMKRFGYNTQLMTDMKLVRLMGYLANTNRNFIPELAYYISSDYRAVIGEIIAGVGAAVSALDAAFKTSDDLTAQTQAEAALEMAKAEQERAKAEAESAKARAKTMAIIGVSAVLVIGAIIGGVVFYRNRQRAKAVKQTQAKI